MSERNLVKIAMERGIQLKNKVIERNKNGQPHGEVNGSPMYIMVE